MAEGDNGKTCSQNQENKEDRISGLPDSLIHHILSFMEMIDVIKTCLLSRRWRYLWRTVPVLDFRSERLPAGSDMASFVGTSLMLYEARKIRRFRIDLRFGIKVHTCPLDLWIRFVVTHDVEELVIAFRPIEDKEGKKYFYPHFFCDCRGLRVLKLGACFLDLPDSSYFPLLTTLDLLSVQLTKLDTSRFPNLENLAIRLCDRLTTVYAPNEKLRHLEMEELPELSHRSSGVTIYAPHVTFIEFTGGLRQSYNFKNLSSIKRATLEIFDEDSIFLVELLKNLSQVKVLKLCHWCTKVLDTIKSEISKIVLGSTHLELETGLTGPELCGIASLLKSCQCLETLIINIDEKYLLDEYSSEEPWESLDVALSAHARLRTVKIRNFLKLGFHRLDDDGEAMVSTEKFIEQDCAHEIKLVKVMLESCRMLDKMIISTIKMPPWSSSKSELLPRIMKELLGFPRSSVNAKVDFSWNPAAP